MDFRELEYFVTIAEKQNLTHAAQLLYVSQPTLTKYLQRLEQEQGIPLFSRHGKQLLLTYAGERYLFYARQLLSLKQSLENEMADIKKLDIGMLHVGMPPFRCSFALPAVLPKFHRIYPNVTVEIMEDSSANLDAALMDGRIDLSFYNLSAPRSGLCYETLDEDQIYAILPKDHPIKERAIPSDSGKSSSIYLEWLHDETFLLQDRTQRQGEYILRELREKNITPKKILTSSNIRAAASLAASGYGVAFLSGGLLRHFEPLCEFDYYSLIDLKYSIHYVAAWRENHYLPGYAQEFIHLMKECR